MKDFNLFILIFFNLFSSTLFAQCNCEALPPPGVNETSIVVNNANDLQIAINQASGATTIYLEDGIYDVSLSGGINIHKSNITIRSLSENRDAVIVQGAGMSAGGFGHGLYINASHITITDLTVKDVQNHAIFVAPENQPYNLLFHNIRCIDTGEQIFKASGFAPKNNGIIECSVFEYTTTLYNGSYTNGIDLVDSHNWIIRDNLIKNIKAAPGAGLAGPAILVWYGSSNTIVERNKIINCDMGIFFGNSSLTGNNHTGGIIKNNFIKGYEKSDAAIGIVRSADAKVINNSIYSEGTLPWSIEVRYPESTNCTIMNNIMDRVIVFRDGATATLSTNIENVTSDIFVEVANGDLHLASENVPAINSGTITIDRTVDIDCGEITDGKPDIGADEYGSVVPVELHSFIAYVFNRTVRLEWRTASETNNYGFEIERITNWGWQKIGFVKGNGTTNVSKSYYFIDDILDINPNIIEMQYRLKQVDFDGNFVYSQILKVNLHINDELQLSQSYPNPFNDSTIIEYILPSNPCKKNLYFVELTLFNERGQLVKTLVSKLQGAGRHQLIWKGYDEKGNKLSSGIFYYVLKMDNEVRSVRKLIFLK